jgi:Family of unknown function (DUF6062)
MRVGDHGRMPRLPARSGADIALADAFAAAGCPLCRARDRTEAAWLESILAESVNDVPFRRALDEARGLCARHAGEILAADRRRSGILGAAILLRATLRVRLLELEAAARSRGRSRARRLADAAAPPACPACMRVARSEAAQAERLVGLAEEPAWGEAMADAPFCLAHLLALMTAGSRAPAWDGVEARQLDRLRELADRLETFAHTSSHDRRHLQTDADRGAVDEAAAVLGSTVAEPSTSRPS